MAMSNAAMAAAAAVSVPQSTLHHSPPSAYHRTSALLHSRVGFRSGFVPSGRLSNFCTDVGRTECRRCARVIVASSLQQQTAFRVSEQQIDEVKDRLASEHGELRTGKNGRDDRALIEWFLRDRKLNVDATVAKLNRALKWRTEFGVDAITDDFIAGATKKGAAYLHSYKDKRSRPTIIVEAKKHFPADNAALESERLCVALIERGIDQLPPGTESLLGIFDLRGFTSKNTDWKFVRFLVDVFYEYYPKRLGEVLFIDAPFIFSAGWKAFKPILGKYSQLVRFCSVSDMADYFSLETMPETLRD